MCGSFSQEGEEQEGGQEGGGEKGERGAACALFHNWPAGCGCGGGWVWILIAAHVWLC